MGAGPGAISTVAGAPQILAASAAHANTLVIAKQPDGMAIEDKS
jgi:hypothetical protein